MGWIMPIISRLSYLMPLSMTHGPWVELTQWPLLRVIRDHKRWYSLFASNFWQNSDIAGRLVPMCFSRPEASTDMQYDLSGSQRNLTWPWPEIKFSTWFFKVKMRIFRRVSAREIRLRPNYFADISSSKVIRDELFMSYVKNVFDPSWPL